MTSCLKARSWPCTFAGHGQPPDLRTQALILVLRRRQKDREQQVTQANGVGMFLTASSKNKEAVYDFFKYWNSVDTQVEWCLGTGFPPARTDIADDARLNDNPYIKEFAKPANESQMYLQQLTNFADIENQAITPAFEKILLQNADVKESLDEKATDIIQSMLE